MSTNPKQNNQSGMSHIDVQTCYYCDKECYAVDDDSFVVCPKCWLTERRECLE